MSQRIGSYARKAEGYAPWSRDVPWYWIAIEGGVGVLLGLYFVFSSDAAASTVRYLVAAVLIGASAFDVLVGFRNARSPQTMMSPLTPYWLVRGGAGLALGIMALVAERSDDISDADARKLIGYGLLVWGLVGVVGNLDARFTAHAPWVGIVGNALALLIGAALLYNNQQGLDGSKATKYIGYAALIGGAILLAQSYLVRREQDDLSATEPATLTVTAPVMPEASNAPSTGSTPGTVANATTVQPPGSDAETHPPASPTDSM